MNICMYVGLGLYQEKESPKDKARPKLSKSLNLKCIWSYRFSLIRLDLMQK